MRLFGAVVVSACLAVHSAGDAGVSNASAAELPCSQVRLVVPYAAGGATDVAARLVAQGLEVGLKRTVIVETRPGASGNVGTAAVVASRPDGCTLLVNAAVIATFPHSFTKLAYDPIRDLSAVGGIGITPSLLVTANTRMSHTKDLIQWGNEKPGGLSFSSAGYGLLQHLAVEEIARRSGARFTHVPYRGGGQATSDLLSGAIDFGALTASTILPLAREGRVKIVAFIQEKRTDLAPEIPTTTEQGFPGPNAGVHFMLFAPPGTAKEVVEMISDVLKKVVGDEALRPRFRNIGFDPTPLSPRDVDQIMRKTAEDWAPVIKRLNIRLD